MSDRDKEASDRYWAYMRQYQEACRNYPPPPNQEENRSHPAAYPSHPYPYPPEYYSYPPQAPPPNPSQQSDPRYPPQGSYPYSYPYPYGYGYPMYPPYSPYPPPYPMYQPQQQASSQPPNTHAPRNPQIVVLSSDSEHNEEKVIEAKEKQSVPRQMELMPPDLPQKVEEPAPEIQKKSGKSKSASKSESEDDQAYMPEHQPFVIKRKIAKEPKKKKMRPQKESKEQPQEKKSEQVQAQKEGEQVEKKKEREYHPLKDLKYIESHGKIRLGALFQSDVPAALHRHQVTMLQLRLKQKLRERRISAITF